MGYFKYIHIATVAAGILLPIIPVIICFKVEGYAIYLNRPDCVPRNVIAMFYSYLLPIIVVASVGLYLLILILWKFVSEVCSYIHIYTSYFEGVRDGMSAKL